MTTEKRALTKGEVLKSLDALPDDATIEDMLDRLYLIWKLERRIAEADATSERISQEEVEERVRRWQA